MKSGYDQFFKDARKAAARQTPRPKVVARPQAKVRSAEEIKEEIRKSLLAKRKSQKKASPMKMLFGCTLGLALAIFGFLNIDQVETWIQRVEISMMGESFAQTSPTKAPAANPAKADVATDKKDEEQKSQAEIAEPIKKEFTQDEINHFSKLNERKRELDLREEELAKMEQELQTQREALDKRLRELEDTRTKISSILEERVKVDEKKVDTLVQMYSNMKPITAAKIIEAIDEDLAVEVLGRMKKKNAADIMNLLKPDKAQILSEKYAGYKIK